MSSDGGEPCYLITALDTEGVDVGATARFEGVAVQRYSYGNTIGGGTISLLVVGRFAGRPRHVLGG